LSNLFLVNLGIKAKKKRLGGGGGGGALPPISPFTILGKTHYSHQTNSGLTQPNLAFTVVDANSGGQVVDTNGVNFADYEVRDYITGTLRGIAADTYPGNSPNFLNITLPQTYRQGGGGLADLFLYPRPAIYNPNGTSIGQVDYTASVVVDAHNLVGQGILVQMAAPTVSASNAPMFNTTFVNNPLVFAFAQIPGGGGLPHPIASGELIIQYTATIVTKSGNIALTTGNPTNASETTKQSFYLDVISL
tara:strand:+ start:6999 stop:7742 length:744 start_codon:yes stop_codon:yes gene_type:complete